MLSERAVTPPPDGSFANSDQCVPAHYESAEHEPDRSSTAPPQQHAPQQQSCCRYVLTGDGLQQRLDGYRIAGRSRRFVTIAENVVEFSCRDWLAHQVTLAEFDA